jgi:hypothetical protein
MIEGKRTSFSGYREKFVKATKGSNGRIDIAIEDS